MFEVVKPLVEYLTKTFSPLPKDVEEVMFTVTGTPEPTALLRGDCVTAENVTGLNEVLQMADKLFAAAFSLDIDRIIGVV
ncbi:MAG: hypothetical protein IPG79_17620 [Saprospiraceae bacterium]|nr:hypothetical protein [Saprospiraceae bacterium]